MPATLLELLNALIRWIHVVAGIMWIGTSLFFVYLENRLQEPSEGTRSVEGDLRLVHGGGYWQVEKRLFEGHVPEDLEWFKYEAYTTWVSGICLLVLVYYMGGHYLAGSPANLTPGQSMGVGLGSLALGWLVYDRLWRSPLGKRPRIATFVSLAMLLAAIYGLTHLLPGRAAFMHVGALLGTLMAANVFMRIIPNQKKVVAAVRAGEPHDLDRSAQARLRSRANNAMTLPVVFIMVGNHYAALYDTSWNWLVLAILIVAGALVNHFFNLFNQDPPVWGPRWIPASAATLLAAFGAIFFLIAPARPGPAGHEAVRFADIGPIIAQRCATCHSAIPADPAFASAPLGVRLDTPEQIQAQAARIRTLAVDQETMPLGNKTGMTPDERALLGAWIAQGAKID